MDWDLKMPPWEMAEMEASAEPNIGSIVGSSSGMGIQSSGRGLDCSFDLKLGDFGSAEKWKDDMRAPISSPGKRVRPSSSGSHQNVSCLVDGCRSDLSGCKEYHRRHKVCETHSKTPIVMVGGKEQRFCQQCSRFHLLVEFDEVKRSCRKRLDGHNRRRRKPLPESNSANMFSNHQGTMFSSNPQIFPTAASDPTWPDIVKSEEEPLYARHSPMHFLNRQHHHFPVSFARSFKEGKNFPFSQETDRLCQPLRTIASPKSSSSCGKIFPVLDSDCALSLLSSPPQTSAINLGQIGDRNPMGQSLLSYGGGLGLARYSGSHQASNYVSTTGFSCSGMEDDNVGSTVLVSDSNDHEMNCQGFFGVGGEGSSDGGTQALPFYWQ